MKTIKSLLVMALVALSVNAFAENKCYIPDFKIEPGETQSLNIMVQFDGTELGGWQMRILPPTGLTFAKTKGKYHVTNDIEDEAAYGPFPVAGGIYQSWLINESKVLTEDDDATTRNDIGALSLMQAYWTADDGDSDKFQPGKEYPLVTIKVAADASYDNSNKLDCYNTALSVDKVSCQIADHEVETEVVETLAGDKAVQSVKYFNLLGVESAEPFDGVNVVVTTYVDGTKAAQKVVK